MCSFRIRSLPSALREVAIWLADSDVARIDAVKSLKALYKTPKVVLSNDAVACHLLRNTKTDKRKNKKQCLLCSSAEVLKKYESLIFSVTKEEENDDELYDSEEEEEEEVENKYTKDLKGVQIHKNKKEQNWNASPQECVLKG